MRESFQILLFVIASIFKSQRRLAAENLALRHQVLVLKRKHRGRIMLCDLDRVLLAWLSRIAPAVVNTIIIVKPETLVRWHRRSVSGLTTTMASVTAGTIGIWKGQDRP